jgi:DNA-binding response OmpR family regulator
MRYGKDSMVGSESSVLLYSTDTRFSDLLTWNLAKRGFRVRQQAWAACHAQAGDVPTDVPPEVDLIVADLDCMGPACWQAIVHLRRLARSLPVVFLAYEWPNSGRLGRCRPCGYLRKPFAVDELLRVLQEFMPAAAA